MAEDQERTPRYIPPDAGDPEQEPRSPGLGAPTTMPADQSADLAELFAALAEAQLEIQNAEANEENDFLKTKYANLAAVMTVCREPLAKQGLTIMQFPLISPDAEVLLETVLAHKSGQYMSSRWSMPVKDNQPQTRGATLTYLRRYSVSSILGIAQYDDDAQSAQKGADEYERITAKEADEILMKADELFPGDFGGGAEFVLGRMLEKIFSTSAVIIDRISDLAKGSAPQAMTLLENTHKRETEAAKKEPKPSGGPQKEKPKADAKKPPKDK